MDATSRAGTANPSLYNRLVTGLISRVARWVQLVEARTAKASRLLWVSVSQSDFVLCCAL